MTGEGGGQGENASRVYQGTQLSPVGHSSLSQNMNKKKININKEGKENVGSYFAKKQHLQFMNYAESVQITRETLYNQIHKLNDTISSQTCSLQVQKPIG